MVKEAQHAEDVWIVGCVPLHRAGDRFLFYQSSVSCAYPDRFIPSLTCISITDTILSTGESGFLGLVYLSNQDILADQGVCM
jgi:hypothetical protein